MKNNADVLLINPSLSGLSTTPYYVMPLSLLSLIAYLRGHDVSAELLDLNVERARRTDAVDDVLVRLCENRIADSDPRMVGASVMVAGQVSLMRGIMRAAKRAKPEAVTVVGGAHVSQFPREILEHCPEVDFVVIGEGEPQALECARFARTGIRPAEWPDGIAFRSGSQIIVKPKVRFLEEMVSLPDPAYDIVNFDDYRHDTTRWHNPYQVDLGVRVPINTSRGCPNRCNFCSVRRCMGPRYRAQDPKRIVDMIQRLHERHGVRCIAIYDANFAQIPERVLKICEEIKKRSLTLSIDLPTGLPINRGTEEMIEALVAVGLFRTCISVESGDAVIRNEVMMKAVEQEDIFRVVRAIRRHPQVFLLSDFVMGMPEDTRESLEASYRLIENLDTDDITLSLATPYPGTELYSQCARENLFHDVDRDNLWKADWYNHNHTGRFVIKPHDLEIEVLADYRDRILGLRQRKIAGYHHRMKTVFGFDSQYMRL